MVGKVGCWTACNTPWGIRPVDNGDPISDSDGGRGRRVQGSVHVALQVAVWSTA